MSLGATPICLSGGARGSDLQFGLCAGLAGHQVFHFIHPSQRSDAPESERVILSPEQLGEADPHLVAANAVLGRSLPFHKPWIVNLLRRNFFQVRDAERVYAVAGFDAQGRITGGTAWAVMMFLARFPPGQPCPVYLFDQGTELWHTWDGTRFLPLPGLVPVPEGVYAGIGTRDYTEVGNAAIRSLYGFTEPLERPEMPAA